MLWYKCLVRTGVIAASMLAFVTYIQSQNNLQTLHMHVHAQRANYYKITAVR